MNHLVCLAQEGVPGGCGRRAPPGTQAHRCLSCPNSCWSPLRLPRTACRFRETAQWLTCCSLSNLDWRSNPEGMGTKSSPPPILLGKSLWGKPRQSCVLELPVTHSGSLSLPLRADREGSKQGGRGGPRNRIKGPFLPPLPQTPKRNRSWGWQARPKITSTRCQDLPLCSFSCFVGTAVSRPRPQGPGPSPGKGPAELGQGLSPPPSALCASKGHQLRQPGNRKTTTMEHWGQLN